MGGAPEEWRICDDCGARVPVLDLVRAWCDACGWNLSEAEPKRNSIDRKIDALGKIHGAWLLNQLMTASEADLRPRITPATIAAFVISFLVFTANLLVGLAGLYLIIWGWPHVILVGGGLILLVICWFLRPQLGSIPKDCVARGDFPALFAMIDRIAAELAIKPVEHVKIDEAFNASMGEAGFARAPILTIGLPMWVSFTPQERVALIGHELAHRVNNDPARSTIIWNGLLALDRWNYLLEPPRYSTESLGEVVMHALMRLFGGMTRGVRGLLASLLFVDSQRAEYLADHLAAKVAGSEAVVMMMRKLGLGYNLRAVAERVYYGGDTDGRSVIAAFHDFASAVPAREMERIKRVDEREEARIDASHPPTASRIRFIEGRARLDPIVVLDDVQSRAMDNELQPFFARLSMKLMDDFRLN